MGVYELSGSFLSVLGQPERVPLRNFNDRALMAVQCRGAALSNMFGGVCDWSGRSTWESGLYGAACEFDPALAELKALGEAAERYANAIMAPEETRVARASELGGDAFAWWRLPKLSPQETADSKQALRPFSESSVLRWVSAVDMHSARLSYVPLVLTNLYPRAWSSERFTYPISTGTALHPDPWQAMVSATLEVIERDALSLNWLLRRPLRRIKLRPSDFYLFDEETWAILQHSDLRLYDAATDIGVPIVYARRCRPAHPRTSNAFGCACDFDVVKAIGKAAREALMISHALESTVHTPPSDPADCDGLIDGACFMMVPEHHKTFAFLDEGGEVDISELVKECPASASDQFQLLTRQLATRNQPFYLAELTPDELREVGLRVFRAVLPGLMPLSFVHRARFLASRRLSHMHRVWQLPCPLEECFNPWPQPFS